MIFVCHKFHNHNQKVKAQSIMTLPERANSHFVDTYMNTKKISMFSHQMAIVEIFVYIKTVKEIFDIENKYWK